jgi:hypothetical protein
MAPLDRAKLVVARCRGGRWLVSEKMGRTGNAGIDFRMGSLVVFQPQRPTPRGHQETARFPHDWMDRHTARLAFLVSRILRRND